MPLLLPGCAGFWYNSFVLQEAKVGTRMTFKEYVAALAKELGAEIESEGDACAFSLGSGDQSAPSGAMRV